MVAYPSDRCVTILTQFREFLTVGEEDGDLVCWLRAQEDDAEETIGTVATFPGLRAYRFYEGLDGVLYLAWEDGPDTRRYASTDGGETWLEA